VTFRISVPETAVDPPAQERAPATRLTGPFPSP